MFSSGAAQRSLLPTPPFPLSRLKRTDNGDNESRLAWPAPRIARAPETTPTRFGNVLPLRFWEQAAIIVFMAAGSSAPDPGSAG